MKEYTVIYKSGKSEVIECADKESLIRHHFNDDEDRFKNEVTRLLWSTLTMRYTEDVGSGEVNAEITSADVNPYGWRNN
ncbi:MAG: hypothetical protein R3345_06000 [Fulvivirga sp.]|nr:hypothetical protein [Fulvivirga sp.]